MVRGSGESLRGIAIGDSVVRGIIVSILIQFFTLYGLLDESELVDALRKVVVIQLEDDPQAVRLLLEEIGRKHVEIGNGPRCRSELQPPLRLDQHATAIPACLFERDNS